MRVYRHIVYEASEEASGVGEATVMNKVVEMTHTLTHLPSLLIRPEVADDLDAMRPSGHR
jgi:hypothetical protein